jgi:hypothetical protein
MTDKTIKLFRLREICMNVIDRMGESEYLETPYGGEEIFNKVLEELYYNNAIAYREFKQLVIDSNKDYNKGKW